MQSKYYLAQTFCVRSMFHMWFTVIFFFTDWQQSIGKVLLKLVLLPLSLVLIVLSIVTSIFTLAGYVVNFIPLVRGLLILNIMCIGLIAEIIEFLIVSYNRSGYRVAFMQFQLTGGLYN